MPHECTTCNRTFPDGSKEMLSGCPDCGGNKFRYRPEGGRLDESDQYSEYGSEENSLSETPTEGSGGPSRTRGAAETVSNAASTLRNMVGGSDENSADHESGSTTDDGPGRESVTDPGTNGGGDPLASGGSTVDDASVSPESTGEAADSQEATPGRSAGDASRGTGSGPDPGAGTDPGGGASSGRDAGPGTETTPRSDRDSIGTDDPTSPDPDVGPITGGDSDEDRGTGGDARNPATGSDSEESAGGMADTENAAQASARSSVVDPDEIDGTGGGPGIGSTGPDSAGPGNDPSVSTGTTGGSTDDRDGSALGSTGDSTPDRTPSGTAPGSDRSPSESGSESSPAPDPDDGTGNIEELRAELNDQFESIKIVEPGQYELNLMELYDREEYIISLMEDGRYVIEVPEKWRGDAP